ncbi:MAG TPA: helix-turn-helix domain-containing protein [Solirubrobacteraceae bacterium]|nr:helix-turn-helix domain-containing protein [Solirubrobacteraceae bacterium]
MSSQKRPYELRARAERQLETRRRIVDATVALHEEVGPARTTVAEIARRAGVTRLTVYNHFPEDAELFAACQGAFLARHPLPDLGPALALPDPRERVRVVLCGLYAGYRARAPMTSKVLRDRSAIPALDELMARTADVRMAALADALAAGFGVDGAAAAPRVRAVAALALDFWTWSRLSGEGLGDAEAADLMADLVTSAAARGDAA